MAVHVPRIRRAAEASIHQDAFPAQATETEVIADDAVSVTVAVPDLVASCVDIAVIVAVPMPAGVKTPALLMVPMLVGLTDQVTDEL